MQGRSETGAFVQLNKYCLSSMARFKKRHDNMKWLFDKEQGKYLDVFELSPYELKMIEIDMGSTEVRDYLNDAYIARTEAHEHAQAHQQTPQRNETPMTQTLRTPATTEPRNRYQVADTEGAIINLMRSEIHPRLINQGNSYRGIDAATDLGNIDIQYRGFRNAPIDLISAARFGPNYEGNINTINNAIAEDVYQGAKAQDILNNLQNPDRLGMIMLKPGKVLNTSEYPRVASMYRQPSGGYSQPVVYDLNVLSQMIKDTSLRDLGLAFKFNKKNLGSNADAHLDRHQSAYLLPSSMDRLSDAIITNQFFS